MRHKSAKPLQRLKHALAVITGEAQNWGRFPNWWHSIHDYPAMALRHPYRRNWRPAKRNRPILRCTWCMIDIWQKPCPCCGNTHTVATKFGQHTHEWSRLNLSTVECKRCGKQLSMENYLAGRFD